MDCEVIMEQVSADDRMRLFAFGCSADYLGEDTGSGHIAGMDLWGLTEAQLEETVIRLLKPSRVSHVQGCRETAALLAKQFGANVQDATRAALLHDITKALDGPLQLVLCKAYHVELKEFSLQNPKTLHALTGSLVAQRVFGENRAVVDAIACHTTGKANMNLLEKIIYVADYVEPNRNFPGVDELRSLAFTDITAALKLGLTMTVNMLQEQNREISPESVEALRFLQNAGV